MTTTNPTSWTLPFALATNPLPMNGRKGTTRGAALAAAQWVKTIRLRTKFAARNAHIPALGRCTAKLTWYVLDNRKRDIDNLAKLEKAMFDGLVDAGIVTDDIPNLMKKHRADIVVVDKTAHRDAWMELTVTTWNQELLILAGSGVEAETWAAKHGVHAGQYVYIINAQKLRDLGPTGGQPRIELPMFKRRTDAGSIRNTLAVTDSREWQPPASADVPTLEQLLANLDNQE